MQEDMHSWKAVGIWTRLIDQPISEEKVVSQLKKWHAAEGKRGPNNQQGLPQK